MKTRRSTVVMLDAVTRDDSEAAVDAIQVEGTDAYATLLTLGTGTDKSPPTEIRLFASGITDTTKGKFLFDSVAATRTMARFVETGKDRLPFDYDHGMTSFSGDKRAAAWFVPVVRNGELWATDIQWTTRALKEMSEREWRFYSPTFRVSHWPDDPDLGAPIAEIICCALTNLPATKNQKPIVTSERPDEVKENASMKLVLQKLGVSEESEALVRVTALLSDEAANVALLSSLGFKTVSELAGALNATKEVNKTMSLAVRKSRISELSVAGRLPPAQHAYAETLSDESFAAFIATLPESQKPAPATPSLSLTPLPNGAGHGGASVPASTVKLTVEELEMAKKFGQNPDDMLSVKAELNAGANFFQYTPKSPTNTLVTK